jgi:hypothetical protein
MALLDYVVLSVITLVKDIAIGRGRVYTPTLAALLGFKHTVLNLEH